MSVDVATDEWLTVPEAAAAVKSSPKFILRELQRKNLRGTKLKGVGWRIAHSDLLVWMDAQANVSRVRRRSA